MAKIRTKSLGTKMVTIYADESLFDNDQFDAMLAEMQLQEVLTVVCEDGTLYLIKTGDNTLDLFDAGENGENLQ